MRPLSSDRAIARAIRQARPYWLHLAGVLILSLAAAPLTLLLPLPLKIAVDSVIGSQPAPELITWAFPVGGPTSAGLLAIAAGMLVLTTVLSYLQSLSAFVLEAYTGEKLTLAFRAVLFQHIQHLSLSYHDTRGSTSNYRIQYDAPCIQWILVTGGIPLVTAAATVIGMLAVTMLVDWQMALVALALCPVLLVLTYKYGARLRLQWHEIKEHESSAMSVVEEALGAVRVVKAFGQEGHEQER